jgi:hypothetical protein
MLIADENKQEHDPEEFCAIELPEDLAALPSKNFVEEVSVSQQHQDKYLEAYIQGLLDARFSKYSVAVTVRNGQVLLSRLPKDAPKAQKIVKYVKKFSAGASVTELSQDIATTDPAEFEEITRHAHKGIWFPQSTVLYPTEVANPRHIAFSGSQRFRDSVGGQNASAVSFGDQFPMYRWANMWKWRGDLQLEIEAGVFAVFKHHGSTSTMQNADYYAGIPLSYAVGPWAHQLRVYHISSHLGDEFMKKHRHCHRRNKSFEALDFSTSYQVTDAIRVYGRTGAIVHSDSEMRLKPFYFEYGTEARIWRHNFTQLYGQPFFATYFRNAQEHGFYWDQSYALGYEWGKIQGFGRKVRCYLQYYTGHSQDGQFSGNKTHYTAIQLEYGF